MTKEERKVYNKAYMKVYNKANLDKMNAFRKAYYAANIKKEKKIHYNEYLHEVLGYGVTKNYIKKK